MPEIQNVSVTVSITSNDKNWLVRLAKATGHMRTHPATGEVDGNLSWSIQEAIGFLRSHRNQYMRESAGRIMEGLEGAGDE